MNTPSDVIACPNCPTSPSRIIAQWPTYALRRCMGCGLVIREPLCLDRAEESSDTPLRYLLPDAESRHFARDVLDLVQRIKEPPGQLLDLGCETGTLLRTAENVGWSPAGIERDEWPVAVARRRGLFAELSTDDYLPFPPDSFDVILLRMLPRVPHPDSLLQSCWSSLRRDGVLVVSLPNFDSLESQIGSDNAPSWWSEDDRWLFSFRPLDRLLRRNGFVPVGSATTMAARCADTGQFGWFDTMRTTLANWLRRGEILHVVAKLGWPE